jgi:hypothetical protein
MIDITTAWIIGSLIIIIIALLVFKIRLNYSIELLEKDLLIEKLKKDLSSTQKYIIEIEKIMDRIIIWEERIKLSFYQDQKDIAITKINSLQGLLREKIDNLLRIK